MVISMSENINLMMFDIFYFKKLPNLYKPLFSSPNESTRICEGIPTDEGEVFSYLGVDKV